MHPTIPIHTMLVLNIAQQAVMQTFLGKGLFLPVAPSVLPTVSWTLDKAHLPIVLFESNLFETPTLYCVMSRGNMRTHSTST